MMKITKMGRTDGKEEITKSTRKKFPVSWIFKIIKREGVELKVA